MSAIYPSWSKFGSEQFSMKKNTLFGEEFQSKLTSMVEKETVLPKAVSIVLRDTKRKRALLPTRRQGPARPSGFFKRAPLASMRTGGARIFNRTHSMQVKTGTLLPTVVPSLVEVPRQLA